MFDDLEVTPEQVHELRRALFLVVRHRMKPDDILRAEEAERQAAIRLEAYLRRKADNT